MKNKYVWLLAMLIFAAASNLQAQDLKKVKIGVRGACGMCKDRIELGAFFTKGVEEAEWSWEMQRLTVEVDESIFSKDELHRNIAKLGHDTKKLRAPDSIYYRLPGCCLYREDTDPDKVALPDEDLISGMIYEKNLKGENTPVVGANVYWINTTDGTSSDQDGHFEIRAINSTNRLVVSYIGYGNDTISMADNRLVSIVLQEAVNLDEIQVTHKRRSTEISFLDPIKVQSIGERELLKAACCNLSESFETTPSVDVGFTDAVTGTRKIEMLGLAGPYVQIPRENIPYIRGLAALYGFTYTPGTWIQGIQLNQGAGSVVNGFESITGQINVEVKKPESSERLYLNLYANEGQRLEANLNVKQQISENWSTGILAHADQRQKAFDRNGDGFLDNPLSRNFILMNRWKFYGKNGLEGQFGIKGTYVENRGGQIAEEGRPEWLSGLDTRRVDGWYKTGKVFPSKPYASVGFQFSGVYHDQKSFFGNRDYDAVQSGIYANLIFQSIIDNTNHKIKTGISYQYDKYDESVENTAYERMESVPGAFFEYAYSPDDFLSIVAGIRADYHNNFGAFVSPRLHMKYAFDEFTVIRASAGQGRRTASIFAENIGMFASNRSIVVEGSTLKHPTD